jgi:hypothetical protein
LISKSKGQLEPVDTRARNQKVNEPKKFEGKKPEGNTMAKA